MIKKKEKNFKKKEIRMVVCLFFHFIRFAWMEWSLLWIRLASSRQTGWCPTYMSLRLCQTWHCVRWIFSRLPWIFQSVQRLRFHCSSCCAPPNTNETFSINCLTSCNSKLKIKLMTTLLTLYNDQSSLTSDSAVRLSNLDATQRNDK